MENDLAALGEGFVSRIDTMTVLREDPAIHYKSCYDNDAEYGHVTCSTYRVMEDEPRLMAAFKEM